MCQSSTQIQRLVAEWARAQASSAVLGPFRRPRAERCMVSAGEQTGLAVGSALGSVPGVSLNQKFQMKFGQ